MKDKKIRELASKYKNLNIAYEKEKTMYLNINLGEKPYKDKLTPKNQVKISKKQLNLNKKNHLLKNLK